MDQLEVGICGAVLQVGRTKTLWLGREGFWLNIIDNAGAEKLRPPFAAVQTNSLYSNKEPSLGKK